MIQIPGFPDYYVDNIEIVSMKYGKRRVLSHSIDSSGYKLVSLSMHGKVKTQSLHRLIARVHLPDFSEDLEVDHIDRDKTNNNISNLRMVTKAKNLQNIAFKGASYHKASGKYQVRIMVNGKRKHLGYFDTEEEAHDAYITEKLKLHPTYTHKENE